MKKVLKTLFKRQYKNNSDEILVEKIKEKLQDYQQKEGKADFLAPNVTVGGMKVVETSEGDAIDFKRDAQLF